MATTYTADFEKALQVGRPPNIKALFPNSKALIVSGKVVDRAMLAKGKAIAMAANGRNYFVIRGALMAAQRANCPLIIEIAKSEGGRTSYCAVNYWNMARIVDALCNELGITVPVAIHADHYGIKNERDLAEAKVEVPTMFEAGINAGAEANMAKMLASEAAWSAAEMCVQTHGGFGFAEEYDIERKFREARLYTVAPISTNMILNFVSEHVLGLPRSY